MLTFIVLVNVGRLNTLQKCYSSLVENLNVGDVDCLKYSLSKGLGIGIVVGGSIMKVPQLLLSESIKHLPYMPGT
jgi:mannose-P-dolichol utilization defect protein 1